MNTHTLEATRIVDELIRNWRAAPPVTVVSTPKDLPVKNPYPDTRGMHRKGETWIVASNNSANGVVETVGHEAIGHHGMRVALGKRWRRFMQAMQSGVRNGDWRLNILHRMVGYFYVDDKNQCYLSPTSHSDEMAAVLAEVRLRRNTGRLDVDQPLRKITKAAVGHMSREGLFLDRPADFEELEGNLLLAEHKLRFGGHFWGIGFLVRRWYASRMSKPWNPRDVPMTLAESEELLKNAGSAKRAWGNFGFFLGIELPIILVGLAWVSCLLLGGFWALKMIGVL